MRDLVDEIRYGLSLYPFAIVIAVGVFLSGTGPTLFQSLTSGIRGVPFYRIILLGGILGLQLIGAVVTAAGAFGALYTVIRDAKE